MTTTTPTTTATTTTAPTIQDLILYVIQTRRFGHTYVHVRIRDAVVGWQGVAGTLDGREVRVTYSGYGRSLQAGGHKYKAHARYCDTQTPVRSKDLYRIES